MNDDIRSESSAVEQSKLPNMDIMNEWQVAKQGIVMWLNNEPEKAESFLKARIDTSVHVLTSYTFINVIVSLQQHPRKVDAPPRNKNAALLCYCLLPYLDLTQHSTFRPIDLFCSGGVYEGSIFTHL